MVECGRGIPSHLDCASRIIYIMSNGVSEKMIATARSPASGELKVIR